LPRLHDLAEDVDVDHRLDGNVDHVVGAQRDVDVGIAVDHQVVDVDGHLLAQAVGGGAQHIEIPSVPGGQSAGGGNGLHQRDVAGGAEAPRLVDRADHGDGPAARLHQLHRDVGLVEDLRLEQTFDALLDLRDGQPRNVDLADRRHGDGAVVADGGALV